MFDSCQTNTETAVVISELFEKVDHLEVQRTEFKDCRQNKKERHKI